VRQTVQTELNVEKRMNVQPHFTKNVNFVENNNLSFESKHSTLSTP